MGKIVRGLLGVLAASVALVASANAGTYSSPVLGSESPGGLACSVSNVGTKSITISGALYDFDGLAITLGADTCTGIFSGVLPAGHSCLLTVGGPRQVRCTVDASSSKVRVELYAYDNDFNVTASVAATK